MKIHRICFTSVLENMLRRIHQVGKSTLQSLFVRTKRIIRQHRFFAYSVLDLHTQSLWGVFPIIALFTFLNKLRIRMNTFSAKE